MRSFMFAIALIGSISSSSYANEDGAPLTLASQALNGACSESDAPDEVYCLEHIVAWSANEWSKPKAGKDESEPLAAGLLLNAHCEEIADARNMNNGTIAACFGDVVRMLDVGKTGGYGALTRIRALKQHAFFAKKAEKNSLSKLKLYGAAELLPLVIERDSVKTP